MVRNLKIVGRFNWFADWYEVSEKRRMIRLGGFRWNMVRWINFVRKS